MDLHQQANEIYEDEGDEEDEEDEEDKEHIVKMNIDLYDAAEVGDLERVQVLVEQGADKEGKWSIDNYTPLYIASENGHIAVVRYLVEQGANIENISGPKKWTAIMTASYHGQLQVTRYLLDQGVDRDKVATDGWTSLHLAAEGLEYEVEDEDDEKFLGLAKLLMVYGADLNARNGDGDLPIDVARTEEIKQAIRDEPRRRLDDAPGKRATEQDRHPNASASASADKEEDDSEEHSNKKPRIEEGAETQKFKVAEEDEDSEPSSDEEDN